MLQALPSPSPTVLRSCAIHECCPASSHPPLRQRNFQTRKRLFAEGWRRLDAQAAAAGSCLLRIARGVAVGSCPSLTVRGEQVVSSHQGGEGQRVGSSWVQRGQVVGPSSEPSVRVQTGQTSSSFLRHWVTGSWLFWSRRLPSCLCGWMQRSWICHSKLMMTRRRRRRAQCSCARVCLLAVEEAVASWRSWAGTCGNLEYCCAMLLRCGSPCLRTRERSCCPRGKPTRSRQWRICRSLVWTGYEAEWVCRVGTRVGATAGGCLSLTRP
mmetsp:Transcript_15016/g.44505  ORF Transcript_15016/g.44505 Transcript_15016/m.44505 type:complete len:268 (+) Transcript_15016:509-1312(+)